MMTIPVRTSLQADGTLELSLQTGLPQSEVDVVVIVQPVREAAARWPGGFLDATYGALRDDPMERPPQGTFEVRESLR